MSEYDEFDANFEPEEEVDCQQPLRKSLILRIAAGATFGAIGAGMLWMAHGISETPQEIKTETAQDSGIPVHTVMTASTEPGSETVGRYVEFAGAGLLAGVGAAYLHAARARKRISGLDGSHEQYDDPLDTLIFEGYCKQVTSDMVWVKGRLLDADSTQKEA